MCVSMFVSWFELSVGLNRVLVLVVVGRVRALCG